MMLSQMSNLQQRLFVSGCAIIILLLAIAFSYLVWFGPIFALLAGAVISLALFEFYQIAQAKEYLPLVKVGIVVTFAYAFAVFLRTQMPEAMLLPDIVLVLALVVVFAYFFATGKNPFENIAVTLFGLVYLTVPLSCLIEINYFMMPPYINDGRWCLLYVLIVTKMTDTAAFFVGKKWGTRQLSPYISPKKTLEGALGGLLGALITSVLFYMLFQWFFPEPPFNLSLVESIGLGLLISIAAQFGDLAESLLKRDVGFKDSSHLPGLGGVLDIVDSLVFTAPLVYIFLQIRGNL